MLSLDTCSRFMGELWGMMKATWEPRTQAQWNDMVERADALSKEYGSDPLVDSLVVAYVMGMEKEIKNEQGK